MSERSLGPGKLRRVEGADGRAVFRFDYRDASGRRRRIHVGHDARTAERVARNTIANRDLEAAGLGGERGLGLKVADVVDRYLAELANRARPRVLLETERSLRRLISDLDVRLLRDITKAKVVDWRTSRKREGSANKTVNNQVATLAAALNFAVELDQIAWSPLAGLKPLPVTAKYRVRNPRALTDDELERLLRAARRHDARRAHQIPRLPLLLFLIATGARWSEAVATRWVDFDVHKRTITLLKTTTKTEKTRTAPLHASVLEQLAALRAIEVARTGHAPEADSPIFRSPDGAAWRSDGRFRFRRYLRGLMREAGIEHRDSKGRVVHLHAMRHTFATRLMHAKVPITVAKELTGHESSVMLQDIYSHATTDDARRAIDSLPSIGDESTRA